jgi:hypothetical protein
MNTSVASKDYRSLANAAAIGSLTSLHRFPPVSIQVGQKGSRLESGAGPLLCSARVREFFATATSVAGRPSRLARGRKPEDLPVELRSVPRTQVAGRFFSLARVRIPAVFKLYSAGTPLPDPAKRSIPVRTVDPSKPSSSPSWRPRLAVLTTMILAAAVSRLIPHPPNFTPIGAMALFGGACFADRRLAFLLPLTALFLSDLVLGLHVLIPVVYGSFALSVLLGCWLRSRRTMVTTAAVTLAGSVQFFLVTNFACWLLWYPHTAEGLVACYVAAIPFFQNTLMGDAAFATALFGGLALAEWRFPTLRERTVVAAS